MSIQRSNAQSPDLPLVRVAVIGGGASGMMAAGTAAEYGAEVTIFEHMTHLGKKLAITGKGRCNITNNCSAEDFMPNITKNARFMYSAIYEFPPSSTIDFFEKNGVETKTERGDRVFPATDKAKTVVDALRKFCSKCRIIYEKVKSITREENGVFLINGNPAFSFDKVIIATGGKSYPLTGSDGSGYRLARSLGHSITELIPSLIPINSPDTICSQMQGLSLKNVSIKILNNSGKVLYSDFGEMMFTHFGVTGPMLLSASAHIRNEDISTLTMSIDLKPALDEHVLNERLLKEFSENKNKDLINIMGSLLPSKMITPFLSHANLNPRKKVNEITKVERKRLCDTLKSFNIRLSSLRPIEEAIITSGGVSVKEIKPGTMESKITPGLYFAGEIIDVDAYTGGFNLQIAFSTGYVAGRNAAIS